MKTTRYTITSKKVIAVALVIVMLATMFVGCTKNEPVNNDDNTTSSTSSQSGENTTLADVQTDNTESTTLADESSAVGDETDETTTKKNTSSGEKETTTKKNTSTGNTTTTTTKVAQATCSHKWGEWKTMGDYNDSSTWYEGRTCSKCGAVQKYSDVVNSCNHSYGSWKYRNWEVRYKTCSKCGYEVVEEGEYQDYCMGSKSEYLELLGYVNQARREAGLNELVYITEWQQGANTRAKELTQRFSHTRPNGSSSNTAYSYSELYRTVYGTSGENIVSGAKTAKQAFNAWMNSSGHRYTILYDDPNLVGFVASRCDTYWVMQTVYDYTPYK